MPTAVPARTFEPVGAGRRVAVIDVGSNSVRLVVFDGLARQAVPVFNEKVLCGLGRQLHTTGRLDEAGSAKALAVLERFSLLLQVMEVADLSVLGTAAVREAADGDVFVEAARERCGLEIEVLSGGEEARLAALGVVSGSPEADGVMGDLGGGSLELVALDEGEIGEHATLPLGQLRLKELAGQGTGALDEAIDESLATVPWLTGLKGRALYAVGGGWRNLARASMARDGYPLRVIHGYTLTRRKAANFAERVARLEPDSLDEIGAVSRSRAEFLPFAARVMARLLAVAAPKRVVFSAYGLREGWFHARLTEEVRRQNPLIEACRRLAAIEGRFPEHGDELARWTVPLFPDETPKRARLRLAACLLSDLAWRAHPDHRADEALLDVLWAPIVGIDHPDRAFVALAVHARYTTSAKSSLAKRASDLLTSGAAKRARLLGLALRLGHTITGGAPGVLGGFSLGLTGDRLLLILEQRNEPLLGEPVRTRFETLARALDRSPEVEVRD